MLRIVLFLTSLLTFPAAGLANGVPAPEPAEIALPAITVVSPVQTALRDRIFSSGMIEPVERVAVQPRIEGQAIEELLVDVGDSVVAGQVMARLSETALGLQRGQVEASIAAARATIAQADASLVEAQSSADEALRVRDRAENLRSQGAGTQAAADQARAAATSAVARVTVAQQVRASAEAQLSVAEAQLADIDLRLARTEVVAPVAGKVVARNAQIGSIASAAGEPMFALIRDGMLELRADVSESDVLRLSPGQPVLMRAVGMSAQVTGTVRLVEPTIDAATRLGRVRVALDDQDAVRAGLFAQAEIIVSEAEAPALPVAAVFAKNGSELVLRVGADGLVERVEIVTGIRDGGMVEVREGLGLGDRVVARAGAFVRPGDRVNPVAADPAMAQSN